MELQFTCTPSRATHSHKFLHCNKLVSASCHPTPKGHHA